MIKPTNTPPPVRKTVAHHLVATDARLMKDLQKWQRIKSELERLGVDLDAKPESRISRRGRQSQSIPLDVFDTLNAEPAKPAHRR